MKKEFLDQWEVLNAKLGYPFENFNKSKKYQNLVKSLKKEDVFSKLKNVCPDDSERERTNQSFIIFHIKNEEELTRLYVKTATILLLDGFEKYGIDFSIDFSYREIFEI